MSHTHSAPSSEGLHSEHISQIFPFLNQGPKGSCYTSSFLFLFCCFTPKGQTFFTRRRTDVVLAIALAEVHWHVHVSVRVRATERGAAGESQILFLQIRVRLKGKD